MHTAASRAVRASDLTARARIRDAAIACFADEGFDASFRTIAQRAGVSPGLITHHFGSKTALRAECDAEVLRHYQELKTSSLADPSASLLQNLTGPSTAAPLVVYLLRAIHAGGKPAQEFLEHLIDGVREVMRVGVETGVVRPSRDEEARLRYLTYQTMGALLIQFLTSPGATPEEFVTSARDGQRDQILPTLELFTEGFLTTRRMLDDYLLYVGDPPR
ncbi:TetR/AcrR family transcriptional regulator [Cellulomonas humilata]|uniref:AcrR family transcriptional regulator n=1 Tax=Cellulomonas humilata TaxID=144055 RepID=A0ABU0E939_9CELL|nr:TetR family transcriptional regulator [Cellulomonas humilata]MDQ0371758.1 AcrR family transcriptional regulator [Cellulomonas humilata]